MAHVIKVNGTVIEVRPAKSQFTLEELQGYVGGPIELVKTRSPKRDLYLHEEGLLLGLPINYKASRLISPAYNTAGGVRGDVIVMSHPGDADKWPLS